MAAEIRSADVRAWAKDNDIKVSDRGRLSTKTLQAYRAANKSTPGGAKAPGAAVPAAPKPAPGGAKAPGAAVPAAPKPAARGAKAPGVAVPAEAPVPAAPASEQLAEAVRRIGDLEAQVAALTERVDAAVSALTKRGRQFRLSRR